ncbi:hypothetical protein ZWY2020_049838 [Hordeum vulgare]|nr:hypothetical protein ZWY2020_014017 [Hordeum vulgare]KAI4976231.1 hypothetical protein ZWY2020_049838 [Hordeum vulgare]
MPGGRCSCREPRQTCRSGSSSLPVLVGGAKTSFFAFAGIMEFHPNYRAYPSSVLDRQQQATNTGREE